MASPMQRVNSLVSADIGNYLTNKETWKDIIYNVKAYGAKGDGTTDDTADIQEAINAANSANGGTVFFPPGVYLCGDLLMKSRVSLYAFPSVSFYSVENDGIVTLKAKTGSTQIVDLSTADGFGIYNLFFDGVGKVIHGLSSGGDTGDIHGCKFVNCNIAIGGFKDHYNTVLSIWRCFFKDNVNAISNIIDSKIDNNYFYENDNGMSLSSGSNANIITKNKFEWNTDLGMEAFLCKNLIISDNIFDRNGESGLLLNGCAKSSFNSNNFIRNGATTVDADRQNHFYLIDCTNIVGNGNITFEIAINDDGSGAHAPIVGFRISNCTDVAINNNDLTGYVTTIFQEGTANTNFRRLGNLGLFNRGITVASGDGVTAFFAIPHGLPRNPNIVELFPASADAAVLLYFTTDATNIYVTFKTAPVLGTNNLVLRWTVEG